jgi:Zn-dependent peptidase ImmA (M78 family)
MKNNPRLVAQKILSDFGIDVPNEISIEDVVHALDIPLRSRELNGCDGRIIHEGNKSIIVINDQIQYQSRRDFTIAHELGHYLMHRNNLIQHMDSISTMSWFDSSVKNQISIQEFEANTFAAEILLPSSIFEKELERKAFSPELVKEIADKFRVSQSSIIYRFVEFGNHPICVFYSKDNKVKYWKKSKDFYHKIKDCTKIPPPTDSVAAEFFEDGTFYTGKEAKQEILKSVWLDVKDEYVNDPFYEFCLIHSESNLAISVIWED